MGLQTTPITEIPLDPDGTIDQPTWGEAGGPFSVPPNETTGMAASSVLPSNTTNYEWQHPARHIRGMLDRTVLSTEGLFTTCIVSQGTWNVGGGTLSVTLTPTRLVIDEAQDGGVVFELRAVAGSPEVLPALSDSYVDIEDDGTVTVVSVAQPGGEPAVTVNAVRIYKLVTDATELTSAANVPEIPVFPCLGPITGASNIQAGLVTVNTKLTSTTEAELNGINDFFGTTTIGEDAADDLIVEAEGTTNATWTHNAIQVFAAELRVAAHVLWQNDPEPSAEGEQAKTSSGELLYHNGDRVAAPTVSVIEVDPSAQGAAATITWLTTVNRVAAPVRLNIIFVGAIDRAASGVMLVSIEQDNGVDGGGQVWSILGGAYSVTIGTAVETVSIARVRITDATKRLYRVKLDGNGQNVDAREGRIMVVPG